MNDAKRTLRSAMRGAREGLEPEARAAAHVAMGDALARILARHAWVGVYGAGPSEADPMPFVLAFLSRGGRVSYARVAGTELAWHAFPAGAQAPQPLPEQWLVPGYRGLCEPPASAPAHARDALTAIVVPGLAFAPSGVRLGQGGGYYDRALAGYAGLKVGLAYRAQCVPDLPCEPHDVLMDLIVSA